MLAGLAIDCSQADDSVCFVFCCIQADIITFWDLYDDIASQLSIDVRIKPNGSNYNSEHQSASSYVMSYAEA